jgi:glycogen(starch) synthase
MSGTAPSAPLRILFLSREYPPETGGGGIGSYVETMAQTLADRGHEVHVLSCVERQKSSDILVRGVHLHRRGVRRLLPKARSRFPALVSRIEGAFSCYLESRLLPPADIVEAPDWRAEGLAFALLRSRPLVLHLHTPLLLLDRHNPNSRLTRDQRLAARLERVAVRRADLVTSPSLLLLRDLTSEGWLDGVQTRIVRLPIDLRDWESLPLPDCCPPRLLAVGRLEARKAPEIVVQAAALLSAELPELEVVFIGGSEPRNSRSYRDWLVGLAGELQVRCRFVGYVPRAELPAWYGSARAVVVASRYDNFPVAGLEGMAAARPVVCTNATGTAEMLGGTDAGAVVDPNDPNALARALRPYLRDAAAAADAGRAGRMIVKRLCSPERIAQEREDCYREAMSCWRLGRSNR